MNRAQDDLARSVMAGVSTGGRTFTALAAQTLTARADAADQPDIALSTPWVKGVLGLLALAELVGDKLPSTPSRLGVPGLSGRLVAGAACGVIIARRDRGLGWPLDPATELPTDPISEPSESDGARRTLACALTGLASAAAGAWGGAHWRSTASSAFGRDWVGAGLEDAAVVGLAGAAARAR